MKAFTLDNKKAKFKASSVAERDFFRQLKKVAENSANIVENYTEGASITNAAQMKALLETYSEAITPWATRQATKLIESVMRSNKRAYAIQSKEMSKALKEGVAEQNTGRAARALINEQVALIKSLPIEAGLRAQEIAEKSFYEGLRAIPDQSVISRLQKEMGMTKQVAVNRAKLIARTETARANAAINQSRAISVGATHYIWRTSMDGAERKSHRQMNGKKIAYDDPPTLSDGTTTHAGMIYNCFPGSEKLNGFPFLQKVYRHFYTGELSILTLDDGTRTRSTLKHPILTQRGIVASDDINIGDQLVCEIDSSRNAVDNKIKSFDITFEQIFNTLLNSGVFISSSVVGGNFHGDVTDQKVDIISFDWSLINKVNVVAIEKLKKLSFSEPDKILAVGILFGFGSHDQRTLSFLTASDSIVSRTNLIFSLLKTHLTPLEFFCFGLCSKFNIGINQVPSNNEPRNSEMFSDFIFAYSLLVHGFDFFLGQNNLFNKRTYAPSFQSLGDSLDIEPQDQRNFINSNTGPKQLKRVVDKNLVHFSDHVYNLQTISGYYLVEDKIASNCRCWQQPVLPDLE